jgi:sigma-B regulation protein RsbU (phosphoserine phosphatase)
MLLFGIWFPERWSVDERFPWLKSLLVVPLGALAILTAVVDVGSSERYRLVEWLIPWLNRVGSGSRVLTVAAISVFFFALFWKLWTVTNPDSRRRLRLLMAGSLVSLAPMCLLLVAELVSRRPAASFGDPIVLPVIVLFLLFPVTLGYVIVVQRAFGVGMVIRTGVQHALARGGVGVLIALLVVSVFIAIKAEIGKPNVSRARIMMFVAYGFMGVSLLQRFSRRAAAWIDRRFFREAVNAEQLLSGLTEQVRTMVEAQPLMETVTRCLSASLHVERIALLLRSNGSYRPACALGYESEPEAEFPADSATVKALAGERRPLPVYLEDKRSWVWRAPLDEAERQRLERLGAQLLLPVAVRDNMLGFLSLGPKRSEEPYSGSEMRLLEAVALQTGLALEHSRLTEAIAREVARRERLNREIEIAREVQERLFPQKAPVIEGVECAGACRPAQGVGGDYYDFLELPGGQHGFAIGDVSGKGIPAALLMAGLQASLRGQTIDGAPDLAAMMGTINRLIYDATPSNRYATFFYAQYEPSSRRLRYVNAGHNAPMLFRPGGEVLRLEEGGPVIGLFRPAQYSHGEIELTPGDLMVAFTDGVSEAMNAAEEEWGEERLAEAVRAAVDAAPEDLVARLMAGADAFAAGAPQHDDMTLLVLRVR